MSSYIDSTPYQTEVFKNLRAPAEFYLLVWIR